MSNMKIISIMDAENREQEHRIRTDIEARLDTVNQRITELTADTEITLQRIRNRIQDLTLRVTILEGGGLPT